MKIKKNVLKIHRLQNNQTDRFSNTYRWQWLNMTVVKYDHVLECLCFLGFPVQSCSLMFLLSCYICQKKKKKKKREKGKGESRASRAVCIRGLGSMTAGEWKLLRNAPGLWLTDGRREPILERYPLPPSKMA